MTTAISIRLSFLKMKLDQWFTYYEEPFKSAVASALQDRCQNDPVICPFIKNNASIAPTMVHIAHDFPVETEYTLDVKFFVANYDKSRGTFGAVAVPRKFLLDFMWENFGQIESRTNLRFAFIEPIEKDNYEEFFKKWSIVLAFLIVISVFVFARLWDSYKERVERKKTKSGAPKMKTMVHATGVAVHHLHRQQPNCMLSTVTPMQHLPVQTIRLDTGSTVVRSGGGGGASSGHAPRRKWFLMQFAGKHTAGSHNHPLTTTHY